MKFISPKKKLGNAGFVGLILEYWWGREWVYNGGHAGESFQSENHHFQILEEQAFISFVEAEK